MAGSGSCQSETEKAQHMTVQELLLNNEGIPERYTLKDNLDASPLVKGIPVFDFSHLATGELEDLGSALSSWGCFQVINHGIDGSLLDKVLEVVKQFFALPMEEKKKYSRPDGIEGYGKDQVFSENETLDWTDRLQLVVTPKDQGQLKNWPENPATFREIVEEYSKKIREIAEALLRAMARTLHLPEDSFLHQCGDQAKIISRFNLYPPCPRPDRVLGLRAHADGSVITILLQDKEVEGLQVFKDDQWNRVPIIPHALVVNIGDQAEIMSNGFFRSPVHRAVVNLEKERFSVASFYVAAPDREVGPNIGLISEGVPSLYKTVKNYAEIYFQHYDKGKRPLDAVRIEHNP